MPPTVVMSAKLVSWTHSLFIHYWTRDRNGIVPFMPVHGLTLKKLNCLLLLSILLIF